jgi:hypothetical protein
MKLDTTLAVHDLRAVADYARIAEDIGFDALWTTEAQHDPFLPLAVALGALCQYVASKERIENFLHENTSSHLGL